MGLKDYGRLSDAAMDKVRGLARADWYASGVLTPREAAASLLESFLFQMASNGPGGYAGNGYAFQPVPGAGPAHRVVAGLLSAGRGHDPALADAGLAALRLFAGCRDAADMGRLNASVDAGAACRDFYEVADHGRAVAFLDAYLAAMPGDAEVARLATDLDRAGLPVREDSDPKAGPRYPDVAVKVAGKTPLRMIETVQKALLKAGAGEAEAYRFRGEAASGREDAADVVRRWVASDLPAPEPDDEPEASGPGYR